LTAAALRVGSFFSARIPVSKPLYNNDKKTKLFVSVFCFPLL
jgi:hypothetical protein